MRAYKWRKVVIGKGWWGNMSLYEPPQRDDDFIDYVVEELKERAYEDFPQLKNFEDPFLVTVNENIQYDRLQVQLEVRPTVIEAL